MLWKGLFVVMHCESPIVVVLSGSMQVNFLKPFLKGKILRSSERGVNSILTTILRFDQLPKEIEFFA